MVRFRPSLLSSLPSERTEVEITLPDGSLVTGRFNPHPQNPNITGRDLVAWIRKQVEEGRTLRATVREDVPGRLTVGLLDDGEPDPARGLPTELRTVVRELRGLRDRSHLKGRLKSWERDPSLRAALLQRWPPRCQVEGCTVAEQVPSNLQPALVEVHHLTHVSDGGSDDPVNLSLICAAHHRLIHHGGESEVEDTDPTRVKIHVDGYTVVLHRDLRALAETP